MAVERKKHGKKHEQNLRQLPPFPESCTYCELYRRPALFGSLSRLGHYSVGAQFLRKEPVKESNTVMQVFYMSAEISASSRCHKPITGLVVRFRIHCEKTILKRSN